MRKQQPSRLFFPAFALLFGCSGPSTTESKPWEPRREIRSFAILGDTAIYANLYAYDIERKGSSDTEIHNRTISFIRIGMQNGSIGPLAPPGIIPPFELSAAEDPQLPDFQHICSYGDIHSFSHPDAKSPPFECEGDAIASSAGGILTAFPMKIHGTMVFDTNLLAVLELPRDTVLELDHALRTVSTLHWASGGEAVWRRYGILSQGVIDSAHLTDPLLTQVEGIGIGIACSDADAAEGKIPCLALASVNGLRQAVRSHCRSNLCEWLPSLGRLAILEPGNLFRFLDPSTSTDSTWTYDAGALLRNFDPRD